MSDCTIMLTITAIITIGALYAATVDYLRTVLLHSINRLHAFNVVAPMSDDSEYIHLTEAMRKSPVIKNGEFITSIIASIKEQHYRIGRCYGISSYNRIKKSINDIEQELIARHVTVGNYASAANVIESRLLDYAIAELALNSIMY